MALQRLRLNRGEVRKMLRGEGRYSGVKTDLERRAKNVAKSAGPGMEADSDVGPNRARASVRTATLEARRREANSRTLTRAVDAGRS